MFVYGDHQFTGQLQPLRTRLIDLVERAGAAPDPLDLLRTVLIGCGQVEQGAHDTLAQHLPLHEAKPWLDLFQQATAQAAAAFYPLAYRQPLRLPLPIVPTAVALRNLLHTLERLHEAPDLTLPLKVPEGFSLYALYPEQYLVAAGQWLADHQHQRAQGAVVVGIRSIGTTLAALVSTVLRAAGWEVYSLTVRPTGHPYNRQVDLGVVLPNTTAFGLVVDEGPGLSGSSLAATASALVEAGIARQKIAFFPGHANAPGGAGSAEVQTWWQNTPRYVAELSQLTFNGQPLQAALAAILPEPVIQLEDFSGGQWRQAVYPDPGAWPAICTAFERIKYRYTLQSGRQVLFKFMGLASSGSDLTTTTATAAALLSDRANAGLATPVLGAAYGFIATAWVAGTPLTGNPQTPDSIETLGRYIAQVAGASLSATEAHCALERLTEMLAVNIREALGEEAVALAQHFPRPPTAPLPCYGDGHLQPYEWLSDQAHYLIKTDSVGHDCDHTLVGKQAVVWDLAGAMVEWQLEEAEMIRLLSAFNAAGGASIDTATLPFYRAAYLAFRLGQCTMAAQVHDPYERERLLRASTSYHNELTKLLAIAPITEAAS